MNGALIRIKYGRGRQFMKQFLRVALPGFIILCLTASSAYSAPMSNFDLASLFLSAEVVVEVEEGEYTKINWMDVGEATVLKVYKGNVKVGDKLKVGFSAFRRVDRQTTIEIVDGKVVEPPAIKFKKALLFLKWFEREKLYLPCADGARLISVDGVVYGFKQCSNPGPYELIKDTPDFVKLKDKEAYDEAKLNQELELAIQYVHEFEKVLEAGDLVKLKTYLASPWRKTPDDWWSVKSYAFSDIAAARMAKLEIPEALFKIMISAKELKIDERTLHSYESAFRPVKAIEFLFSVIGNPDATRAEHELAVRLAARPYIIWDHVSKENDRVAAAARLRSEILQRAIVLLKGAKSSSQKCAAAQLVCEWHPNKPGRSAKELPVPLDDPALAAMASKIQEEKDSAVKLEMSKWYCRLGLIPAYKKLFGSELGLLVFPSGRQRFWGLEFMCDVYDIGFSAKLRTGPHVEATALDGKDAGKVFSGEVWRLGAPLTERMMDCYLPEVKSLAAGRYAFRVAVELVEDGETKIWRSEHFEGTIEPPKRPAAVNPEK
jgi:hypothetical protein